MPLLEAFAARIAAGTGRFCADADCAVAEWLNQFREPFCPPEPDTCADLVSAGMPLGEQLRWYVDDHQIWGYAARNRCYRVPWAAIESLMRIAGDCEDDEPSPWDRTMALAG